MDTNLKTERTKAGLKIYQRFDKDSEWFHIKTVKLLFEPVVTDIDWIKNHKKIIPNSEETRELNIRLFNLKMDNEIKSISYPNKATKDYVTAQKPISIRHITPRGSEPYCVIVMSEGTEVVCSMTLYKIAKRIGVEAESIKRLQ